MKGQGTRAKDKAKDEGQRRRASQGTRKKWKGRGDKIKGQVQRTR